VSRRDRRANIGSTILKGTSKKRKRRANCQKSTHDKTHNQQDRETHRVVEEQNNALVARRLVTERGLGSKRGEGREVTAWHAALPC